MKYPISWLTDYVEINIDPQTLADQLSLAGFEVEGINPIGQELSHVITGKITSISSHPNADRLVITHVHDGKTTHQIVTGATNINIGDIVPVSLPGAILANGLSIKPSKLRGIESNGMLCSQTELGLSDESDGIWILPSDTPIGIDFIRYASLKDTVLDISILPNRGDALSMIGLAREISVLLDVPLILPDTKSDSYSEPTPYIINNQTNHCHGYQAQLIDKISIKPSPIWMQRRLQLCDMNPINNVVDITNYVLLEYGQPLHAFDHQCLGSNSLTITQALPNQSIQTLDEKIHQLSANDIVISNNDQPIALAGVMGGKTSEVTTTTTAIVLETANFDGTHIRRTSNQYGYRTESSIRFEKQVDLKLIPIAAQRAASLLTTHCHARAFTPVSCNTPVPESKKPRTITFDSRSINQLLGTNFSEKDMTETLTQLGFKIDKTSIQVPSWRIHDIHQSADLAEEIIRLKGLDTIPSKPLTIRALLDKQDPLESLRETLHNKLSSLGFNEVITMPMISPTDTELIQFTKPTVTIINPLSREESIMRPHGFPSLLKIAAHNAKRQLSQLKIFEITKVFQVNSNTISEPVICHGFVFGKPFESVVSTEFKSANTLTFSLLKGLIESLFHTLNIQSINYLPASTTYLHPGQSATILLNNNPIGELGLLHPALESQFDLPKSAYWSINLEALTQPTQPPTFMPFTKYPSITRDIALLAPKDLSYSIIEQTITNASISHLDQVSLFDSFESDEKLGANKKSIGITVTYLSHEQTLSDDTVSKLHQSLINHLTSKLPVSIR